MILEPKNALVTETYIVQNYHLNVSIALILKIVKKLELKPPFGWYLMILTTMDMSIQMMLVLIYKNIMISIPVVIKMLMDLLMNVNSKIVLLCKNKLGKMKTVQITQKFVAHVNNQLNVKTSTVSVPLLLPKKLGKLWIPTWTDKST
jgi:hypothetical protein